MVNEEASGMKSSCIPLKFNVCAFNYQFFEENQITTLKAPAMKS